MDKRKRIIWTVFVALILSSFVLIWALLSPTVEEFRLMQTRKTENDLSIAFLIALKTNNPLAYNMIDPKLNDRLDQWMKTHESVNCATKADLVLTAATFGETSSNPNQYNAIYSCSINRNGINYSYAMKIKYIYIKGMKVVDWDQPIEEIN